MLFFLMKPCPSWRPIGAALVVLLAFGGQPAPGAAAAANRVLKLDALANPASWQPAPGDENAVKVSTVNGMLGVWFTGEKGESRRLMLKQPLSVPDGVTDLTVLNINKRLSGVAFGAQFIVRDAANEEFLFNLLSPRFGTKGSLGGDPDLARLHTPGLADAALGISSGNVTPPAGQKKVPQKPYVLLGVVFNGVNRYEGVKGQVEMYFRDFAATQLVPRQSPFYYQIKTQPFFGELDPHPWISLGDFGLPEGKRLRVAWEIRDRYEGGPCFVGGGDYAMDAAGPVPLALQLARKIEFPVLEQGTYWVRVKASWAKDEQSAPTKIKDFSYRLYIARGEKPVAHKVIAAGEKTPQSFVRIAPGRESLLYAGEEKPVLQVAIDRPPFPVPTPTYRLQLLIPSTGATVREKAAAVEWNGESSCIEMPLDGIAPGAYTLKASLQNGEVPVDITERLIGLQSNQPPKALGPMPKGIVSAADIYARKQPMFHLGSVVPDVESVKKNTIGKTKWDFIAPFFEQAPSVSHEAEFTVRWREVEPLPGVYDWAEVDRVLALAKEKGMNLLLTPDLHTKQPDWLPSCFKEEKDGSFILRPTASRTASHYFNCALLNWESAPELQKTMLDFLETFAARYRDNPNVQGYSMFFEYCGAVPSSWNWNDGYDAPTLADYRNYCREQYGSLDRLNQRWGTQLANWADVQPSEMEDSPARRLDWWKFRAARFNALVVNTAKAIRKSDPKRIILYDTLFFDDPATFKQMRALGCALANGGTTNISAIPNKIQGALFGLQERCEEVSVRHWSELCPTQLDVSLFIMTMGGGDYAHCKMFIDGTQKFDDLRKPTWSLDRYEKFMPIWTELRPTKALPFDCFLYQNMQACMLKENNLGGASVERDTGAIIDCMDNHLSYGVGSSEFWKKSKLLLVVSEDLAHLEQRAMDEILQYAKDGGTVVLTAGAGRVNVDGAGRASLLEQFGFPALPSQTPASGMTKAAPASSTTFPALAKPFYVRNAYSVPPPADAETVAAFNGDPNRAALSWRPFGKGKVAVVWAQGIIPPSREPVANPADAANGGLLRELARWAGAKLYTDATLPRFWVNVLAHQDQKTFYGLVYYMAYLEKSKSAVTGNARFLALPPGRYRLTEIVSGKSAGTFSHKELAETGVAATLEPEAVAIYRMERVR